MKAIYSAHIPSTSSGVPLYPVELLGTPEIHDHIPHLPVMPERSGYVIPCYDFDLPIVPNFGILATRLEDGTHRLDLMTDSVEDRDLRIDRRKRLGIRTGNFEDILPNGIAGHQPLGVRIGGFVVRAEGSRFTPAKIDIISSDNPPRVLEVGRRAGKTQITELIAAIPKNAEAHMKEYDQRHTRIAA